MNTKITKQRVLLVAVAVLAATVTACAGTSERRSTGQTLDDVSIATRVKTALLADPVTDGLDIDVEVNRGRVQLNGFADSSDEISKAGSIASNAAGVKSVDNNLKVADGTRTAGQYVDDKVLSARVKTALVNADGVSAGAIDVEANRGIVSLGGFVASTTERSNAETAAARVAGVQRVDNNLTVQ